MKKWLRILSAFAALLMVFSVISCGNTSNGDGTDTTVSTETDITDESGDETGKRTDAEGYELDDLPSGLNFNKNVRVLYWSDVERPEFEVLEEELDGNIVTQAIYDRNNYTEDFLGVTLEWNGQEGNSKQRASFTQFVTNAVNGGDEFDIIATYSRTSGMLATRGYLADLNAIDNSYINLEKPWWPSIMQDTFNIDGSLYFISGDISTNVLHFMYAIYYNVDLLNELGLEDPVKHVDEKTWTIGQLIDMTKDVYLDLDGVPGKSEGDQYGFSTIYYGLDAFYTGSGMTLVDPDPVDVLVISDDFASQKAVDLADKLGNWLDTPDCYVSRKSAAVNYYYPFVDGTVVFCQNRVYMADSAYGTKNGHNLNGVSWKYGIVPTPKYDLDQTDYITVVGNPFTLWSIMSNMNDEKNTVASAVIECLASQAFRETTPALFENNMKYRYTNGSDNKFARMFDILHNSLHFDLGRIFSDDLETMSEMPSNAAADHASWATVCKSHSKRLNAKLAKVVTSIQDAKK
ncbi:MAG: extracellular solute-binding protein [Clostridia bacterium]|nr:extracellular solute-binding protein [Clostridia bacterium]